jgi:HD superfamily phosphohydrolase
LRIPPNDALLIQVAALLHDVGHYDFSHALEELAPYDHEENGRRIITGEVQLPGQPKGQIAHVLRSNGIDPEKITALLAKRGGPAHYASILASDTLDADRMDYLKRDTYYTGAVIGEIDISRLLRIIVVQPKTGELGIREKGIATMEQFLIARSHMYQQVYLHPDSFAAEVMLRRAVEASRDIAMPLLYGDGHLLARLVEHGSPITQELVRRIRAGKRAFYTAALLVRTNDDPALLRKIAALRERDASAPGAFERALLAKMGAKEGEIIVTFGHEKKETTVRAFPVLREDGTWTDLFTMSALAQAVAQEQRPYPLLAIHVDAKLAPMVRDAAHALIDQL